MSHKLHLQLLGPSILHLIQLGQLRWLRAPISPIIGGETRLKSRVTLAAGTSKQFLELVRRFQRIILHIAVTRYGRLRPGWGLPSPLVLRLRRIANATAIFDQTDLEIVFCQRAQCLKHLVTALFFVFPFLNPLVVQTWKWHWRVNCRWEWDYLTGLLSYKRSAWAC